MSIGDDNAQRNRASQKLSILHEASKAGLTVVGVADVGSASTIGSTAGTSVTALFGGTMSGSAVQIFQFDFRGTIHLYAQPYDGMYAIPGEHHIWLGGGLPGSVAFVDSFASRQWYCESNHALARSLNDDRQLCDTLARSTWEWKLGMGKFKYPWNVQMRQVAGGSTHLAVMATGAGQVMTHEVGFSTASTVARQLTRILAPSPPLAMAPFLKPTSFSAVFEQVASGMPIHGPSRRASGVADFGQHVHGTLAPHSSKKVFVHPVPPAKEANAREHVLPPDARHLPIVGLVDLTMMGSAKDAIALTPTHAFFREGQDRLAFAYADVRGVGPLRQDDSVLVLRIASIGEVALSTGAATRALHGLFASFAEMP